GRRRGGERDSIRRTVGGRDHTACVQPGSNDREDPAGAGAETGAGAGAESDAATGAADARAGAGNGTATGADDGIAAAGFGVDAGSEGIGPVAGANTAVGGDDAGVAAGRGRPVFLDARGLIGCRHRLGLDATYPEQLAEVREDPGVQQRRAAAQAHRDRVRDTLVAEDPDSWVIIDPAQPARARARPPLRASAAAAPRN